MNEVKEFIRGFILVPVCFLVIYLLICIWFDYIPVFFSRIIHGIKKILKK